MFGWHMRCCRSIHRALTAQYNIEAMRTRRRSKRRKQKKKNEKSTAGIKRNYRQSEPQSSSGSSNNKIHKSNHKMVTECLGKNRTAENFNAIVLGLDRTTRAVSSLQFWHKFSNGICRQQCGIAGTLCSHNYERCFFFFLLVRSFDCFIYIMENMYRGEHETLVRQSRYKIIRTK